MEKEKYAKGCGKHAGRLQRLRRVGNTSNGVILYRVFFFLGTLRHYRSLLGLDLSQGSVLFFQL